MEKNTFTFAIITNPDTMRDLASENVFAGVAASKPTTLKGPADVLDAPLNPADFQQAAELIKVVFETGAAAIGFVGALLAFLRKHRDAKIRLEGERRKGAFITLDHTSSETEVKKRLGL